MDRVLRVMAQAARAGGEIAAAYFRRGGARALKPDRSPVPVADREGEAAIVRVLLAAFPDYGCLGEESGACGPQTRRFIVDPIDGTRNFVRGIPFWATLIALEEQ